MMHDGLALEGKLIWKKVCKNGS